MNTHKHHQANSNDPLGLGQLESIEPDFDGWDDIEAALNNHQTGKKKWPQSLTWLGVAASLVVIVGLSMRGMQPMAPSDLPAETNSPQLATTSDQPASLSVNDATASSNIESLIGLSNKMQAQVGQMRQQTASMPAESAMYVAELEDLIAQVDNELSFTPDSIDLWGQRVNLLLDLAQIYQQQWQLDYGRMASL